MSEDMTQFKRDLAGLINKHSLENGSDTPDFVLADYLVDSLRAFERASNKREEFFRAEPKESPEQVSG